ncbi:DgyrCDS11473 [Dimorphilus gyrociliatus]|uniref:DgyrCDS11473 n=1 Tax=Dimorphilus gyrociliatus TaxID=2664684 RepID=A0A7I8W4H3_9ANNE|nr:DgyrCDS11473 [Dimorphilus gyrociliatus]
MNLNTQIEVMSADKPSTSDASGDGDTSTPSKQEQGHLQIHAALQSGGQLLKNSIPILGRTSADPKDQQPTVLYAQLAKAIPTSTTDGTTMITGQQILANLAPLQKVQNKCSLLKKSSTSQGGVSGTSDKSTFPPNILHFVSTTNIIPIGSVAPSSKGLPRYILPVGNNIEKIKQDLLQSSSKEVAESTEDGSQSNQKSALKAAVSGVPIAIIQLPSDVVSKQTTEEKRRRKQTLKAKDSSPAAKQSDDEVAPRKKRKRKESNEEEQVKRTRKRAPAHHKNALYEAELEKDEERRSKHARRKSQRKAAQFKYCDDPGDDETGKPEDTEELTEETPTQNRRTSRRSAPTRRFYDDFDFGEGLEIATQFAFSDDEDDEDEYGHRKKNRKLRYIMETKKKRRSLKKAAEQPTSDPNTPTVNLRKNAALREGPAELRRLVVHRETGETMLHKSCRLGLYEAASWLVKTRDSSVVHAKDHAGYTPLHEVATNGNHKIGHLLLQAGANANVTCNDGTRPLHEAIDAGHIQLVRLLLAYGADFNFPTYSGRTPLSLAKTDQMKKFLNDYISDIKGTTTEVWKFSSTSDLLDDLETVKIFDEVPQDTDHLQEIAFDFGDIPLYRLKTSPDESACEFFLLDDIMRLHYPNKTETQVFHEELQDAVIIEITRDDILEHNLQKINPSFEILNVVAKGEEEADATLKLVLADEEVRNILGFSQVAVSNKSNLTSNSHRNVDCCEDMKKCLVEIYNEKAKDSGLTPNPVPLCMDKPPILLPVQRLSCNEPPSPTQQPLLSSPEGKVKRKRKRAKKADKEGGTEPDNSESQPSPKRKRSTSPKKVKATTQFLEPPSSLGLPNNVQTTPEKKPRKRKKKETTTADTSTEKGPLPNGSQSSQSDASPNQEKKAFRKKKQKKQDDPQVAVQTLDLNLNVQSPKTKKTPRKKKQANDDEKTTAKVKKLSAKGGLKEKKPPMPITDLDIECKETMPDAKKEHIVLSMRFTTKDATCLIFLFVIAIAVFFFTKVSKVSEDDESDPIQRKINQLRLKVVETEGLSRDHWNDVRLLKEQLQLLLKANLKLNYSNGVNVPAKLQQFLSNISAISTNDVQHPGIYHYLPHIIGKPQALRPSFTLSKNRQSVSIVAGIPTIKRERESYLIRTLSSLLENSNEEEQDDCLFIVFVAEPWDLKYVKEVAASVQEHFPAAVDKGLIEVIAPPSEFYPNLNTLQETFGDSKERVKWRTKQNLDFSFLMLYARNKASYYIQLEDDIITKYSYLSLIKSFAINQKTPPEWVMLEFSYLGFIGKLFKSTDIPLVVEFFIMFYKDKPIDWLLDHLLSVKVCNPEKDAKRCRKDIEQIRRRYKPSLFQHIGTHSSLKGKVQKLKDKDFGKPQLHKGHRNPHAELSTSLKVYQKYSIERSYIGETFFWAFTPFAGDYITIKFTPPIFIERFLFRSGNSEHPGDKFFNTTIELLPESGVINPALKYPKTSDNYLIVANFSLGGEASAVLNSGVPKIHTMRLMTHSNGTSWVILNEINIVQKKAP